MHVSSFIVANYSDIDGGGLLNVIGGAWEYVDVPQLPWAVNGSLAILLSLEQSELAQPIDLEVVITFHRVEVAARAQLKIVSGRRLTPISVPFSAAIESIDGAEEEMVFQLLHESGPMSLTSCPVRMRK